MHRRELLRVVTGAVSVPALAGLGPDQLLALGRTVHRRTAARTGDQGTLRALDANQNRIVVAVAEHIIPETDTPGATAARVNEFIDLILAEWYSDAERARFLEAIDHLGARGFIGAPRADQIATLARLDAQVTALRDAGSDEAAERHFFHQMKYLTLWGYYTSEVGVEQELRYVRIPGRYDPCVATGLGTQGGD